MNAACSLLKVAKQACVYPGLLEKGVLGTTTGSVFPIGYSFNKHVLDHTAGSTPKRPLLTPISKTLAQILLSHIERKTCLGPSEP